MERNGIGEVYLGFFSQKQFLLQDGCADVLISGWHPEVWFQCSSTVLCARNVGDVGCRPKDAVLYL